MNICLDQMKEEVQSALGEKSETVAAKVFVNADLYDTVSRVRFDFGVYI